MANKSIMKRDDDEARDNRRQDRADELRMLLQGQEYLRQLDSISSELIKMGNKLRRLQNNKTIDALTINAVKARVLILKTRADINFRRLMKVLPDLRSIELTDVDGNNPLRSLIDTIVRNQNKEFKISKSGKDEDEDDD